MDKINIIQIGICHEHAAGKRFVLKTHPDLFNFTGHVDEQDFCETPRFSDPNLELYTDFR